MLLIFTSKIKTDRLKLTNTLKDSDLLLAIILIVSNGTGMGVDILSPVNF